MAIPPLSPSNKQVQPPPKAATIWEQVPQRQRAQLCAQLAHLLARVQEQGMPSQCNCPTAGSKGEVTHE